MKTHLLVALAYACLAGAALGVVYENPGWRKSALPETFNVPDQARFVDPAHPAASDENVGAADLPWKSLTHAGRTAAEGNTVIIRGGIYREAMTIANSGTEARPIVFRSAPGERVQINGSVAILGWRQCTQADVPDNPHAEKISVVELDWQPTHLYEGFDEVAVAQTPDNGWWGITKGLSLKEFTDTVNLKPCRDLEGWSVRILEQAGGGWRDMDIAAYDPAAGKITLTADYSRYRKIINEERDRYCLVNNVSTLDGPGQYVLVPDGAGCRIYLWPAKPGFDGLPAVQAPRDSTTTLIRIDGKNHVIIDGLEVTLSGAHGIGEGNAREGDHFTIQNCYVHHNRGYGIQKRSGAKFTVRRCVISHNSHGIVTGQQRNSLIEENDVGFNRVDGVISANDTDGFTIRRNYIHDHYRWGHPDNIQFWSNVRNLTIEDNVMVHGGQTMMSDGLGDNIRIVNNIWCGSHAVSMIVGCSRETPHQVEIRNNTVALVAAPTNWQGKHFRVRSNIFAPMHPTLVMGLPDPKTCTADYDVLWADAGYSGALALNGGWNKQQNPDSRGQANTLEDIREKLGIESNGYVGDPVLRNTPVYHAKSDYRRVQDCTQTRMVLHGSHAGRFTEGDLVEIDFDGVQREITKAGDAVVEFDPPLDEAPITIQQICNWGTNRNFALDLRLADDSPFKGKGEGGRDPGSSLDIQAYMRGDFDGDGTRDLPDVAVE